MSLPPPPYPRPAPAPGARCHTPNSGWLWSEQQFLVPLQNVIYEFVYLHLHLIVFFIYWPQDTDIGCSVQFSRLPFWYFICLYLHLIVSRLSFKHFVSCLYFCIYISNSNILSSYDDLINKKHYLHLNVIYSLYNAKRWISVLIDYRCI